MIKANPLFRGHDSACAVCGHGWDGGGCCPVHVAGRDLLEAFGMIEEWLAAKDDPTEAEQGALRIVRAAIAKAGIIP